MLRPAGAPSFVCQRLESFHLEIDLRELARTFANEPLPDSTRGRIVGPHDLHVLTALRQRHGIGGPDALAADYFVWATGEPSHRAMTKLGGVPFLPARARWPERKGTIGDFYAQLAFHDSRDLVPPLPGDVLLVFRFHELDHTSWDEELYEFVWVDGSERDLVRAQDVRHSRNAAHDPWPVMHGYRVRTWDAPGQVERVRGDAEIDSQLVNAAATKIGGAPTDMQSVWPPEVPSDWRFLGQITAVWPAAGTPFPVVDHAAPVPPYPSPGEPGRRQWEAMSSGPGDGITCLYLDAGGRVRVHFSCA